MPDQDRRALIHGRRTVDSANRHRVESVGGAATNSGIDFQSRVGALALTYMFAELDELSAFGTARHVGVTNVRFETNDSIDDLALATHGGGVFIQAKRTISLSDDLESEFSSVIAQFVSQYLAAPDDDDAFVLATTSAASSRITSDLKTLTEAARLSASHQSNPLTKTAKDVLAKTSALIDAHFLAKSGRAIRDNERAAILAKIHVQVLDLEGGAPLERAVLIALAAKGVPSASAAWAALISLALTLAKDRLSVDLHGLVDRLPGLLTSEGDLSLRAVAETVLRSALDSDIGIVRECVLLEHPSGHVVSVLPRFDEDGSKVLRFSPQGVTFPDGQTFKVLLRASSVAGFERVLEANPDLLGNENVILDDGYDLSDTDEAEAVEARYRDELRQLLANNADILTCLRCGRSVAEDGAPFVEVDEDGHEHEVGLVHAACRLPTYRVIGALSNENLAGNPWLGDFDFDLWLRQIVGGQGMFGDLSAEVRSKRAFVGWHPSRAHLSAGTWGVVLEHADGNEHFTTRRGQVEALVESQARAQADYMNGVLAQAAEAKDPFCVSPETQVFATHSQLISTFAAEGEPVEIVRATPRELSRAALRAGQRVTNYYAPLLALINLETNEPFGFAGAIVLVTDPLELPRFVANWTAAGVEVPALATAVIGDDAQFDALVASYALRGVRVVINPLLQRDGDLASAIIMAPETLWLAGQRNPYETNEASEAEEMGEAAETDKAAEE